MGTLKLNKRCFDFGRIEESKRVIRTLNGLKKLNSEQMAFFNNCLNLHNERKANKAEPVKQAKYILAFHAKIANRVKNAALDCYYKKSASSWAGGEHSQYVTINSAVACSGGSDRVWSSNGKWQGSNSWNKFVVKSTWIKEVLSKDIASAAGMLTLDATEIKPGVFSATWAQQSRGFELVAKTGVILKLDDGSFVHAETEKGAQLIKSKRLTAAKRQQEQNAKTAKVRDIFNMGKDAIIKNFGLFVVTLKDSTKAGNCSAGTTSFTNKHFDGAESETVQNILAASFDNYTKAACFSAILRQIKKIKG